MDRTCELLALESFCRFLIIVSSPACINRDQILIGSLVNSKQVNGGALQKRNIYSQAAAVRILWLPPSPTPTKLAGSASISGMVSGKSGVDRSAPVHPVTTPLPVLFVSSQVEAKC